MIRDSNVRKKEEDDWKNNKVWENKEGNKMIEMNWMINK